MIASVLTSVVIFIAWTGLLAVINMSNEAQAVTARKIELTRALDMITQEIRQAQSVNRSGAVEANGSTVSIEDVVTNSGLTLADLGNPGDLGLYLEIPISSDTVCPTGPTPAFDRVVYDVRDSPDAWLPPKAVTRYGRIPGVDGSINPCSEPIANDIVADAIASTDEDPECTGVLSGSDGFHTCQRGDAIDLLFKSAIKNVEDIPASTTVTSRALEFSDPAQDELASNNPTLVLTATKRTLTNTVDLAWSWTGEQPTLASEYRLRADIPSNPISWQLPINSSEMAGFPANGSVSGTENVCFRLIAYPTEGEEVESNQECLVLTDTGVVINNGGDDDDDDDDD